MLKLVKKDNSVSDEQREEVDHFRSNMSAIFQSLVTAVLVAMMLWVGNTLYELSNLIAVNVSKTEAVLERVARVETALEQERAARAQFQLEIERRMKQ